MKPDLDLDLDLDEFDGNLNALAILQARGWRIQTLREFRRPRDYVSGWVVGWWGELGIRVWVVGWLGA